MTDSRPLREALRDAGWNPRDLARAINAHLERRGDGAHRIHLTAPYSWLSHGYCPHQPTADAVAHVLATRLGRSLTAADLWPGRVEDVRVGGESADGLDTDWRFDEVVGGLADLARSTDAEIHRIRPASSPALVTTALDGLRTAPPPLRSLGMGERVLPPMMDLLAGHIAALRRLDDRQGGGALSVRYVTGELGTLLDLIRRGSYSKEVGGRLHAAAADLAQLAGWMYFDAGVIGAAQRYFFLGLRAAGAERDPTSAANILGMLAYQTAVAGKASDAVRLAEAADAAAGGTSTAMRARTAGRLATAYAAAGDLRAFRIYAERARTLLDERRLEDDPPALYYLSGDQLAAEAGQGLVTLAASDSRRAAGLLREAIDLLTPLSQAGSEEYQRSALLHGCYLARAHLRRGDAEQACAVARTALARLASVQSRRCRLLLQEFATELSPRRRNPWVADLLPELHAAVGPA